MTASHPNDTKSLHTENIMGVPTNGAKQYHKRRGQVGTTLGLHNVYLPKLSGLGLPRTYKYVKKRAALS